MSVYLGVSLLLLQSRVGGWIKNWLWKGKNEAHLPADDKPSVRSARLSAHFVTTSGSETDDFRT